MGWGGVACTWAGWNSKRAATPPCKVQLNQLPARFLQGLLLAQGEGIRTGLTHVNGHIDIWTRAQHTHSTEDKQ
jgi:hypothetical protein